MYSYKSNVNDLLKVSVVVTVNFLKRVLDPTNKTFLMNNPLRREEHF